jgi:hypothetical protein
MTDRLYTIDDMARDFASYPRKIKAALAMENVRTYQVGKRRCVDGRGYERVRKFLLRYASRPILSRAEATTSA